MPHEPIASALITGAASGIGKFIALSLAAKGYQLTLLDLDLDGLKQTAELISAEHGHSLSSSSSSSGSGGSKLRVHIARLDVSDQAAQEEAFNSHMARFSRLDAAVLNAGIGERGDFFSVKNTGWQRTLDVDLTAVLHGIRCATLAMQACGSSGSILSVASAGALFPMPTAPVYAAAKSALVHFTRSVAGGLFRQQGIRLMALCPEFVDTPMVRRTMNESPEIAKRLLGSLDIALLQPQDVAHVAVALLLNHATYRSGTVMLVRQDGRLLQPFLVEKPSTSSSSSSSKGKPGPAHIEELDRIDPTHGTNRASPAATSPPAHGNEALARCEIQILWARRLVRPKREGYFRRALMTCHHG
ncbi:MAG: hypothetical protein WDW36_004380 [Sanguina aurantia]